MMESDTSQTPQFSLSRPHVSRRRLLLGLPLLGIGLMGGGFALMLGRMRQGGFDPHALASPLVGKPVPDFSLPLLDGTGSLTGATLRAAGHPLLVNFFASWCEPCLEEAGVLMGLAAAGLPLYGIGYKDQPAAIRGFIAAHGNPYRRLALDLPGRTAIDWGVYGVPETYLIDRHGIVRLRYAGPLSPDVVQNRLMPLIAKAAG